MDLVSTNKMTWEDVRKVYPDEWVALVDLELAEDQMAVIGGRVVDHDRSRKAVYARTKPTKPSTMTIKFTGAVGRGNYLF